MSNPWDVLAPTLLGALPDGIEQRVEFLTAILRVMPASHPARRSAAELLAHLDKHLLAQRELVFEAQRGGSRLGDNPVERSTSSRRGR